jgi:hypothetical protein
VNELVKADSIWGGINVEPVICRDPVSLIDPDIVVDWSIAILVEFYFVINIKVIWVLTIINMILFFR